MRVDGFIRANNNSLGAGWFESDAAVTGISISSNQLKLGNNVNVAICYRTEAAWAPNQSCSLKYKSKTGGPCGGPAVRVSGTAANCYCYVVYHVAGATPTLTLRKFVNQSIPTSAGGTSLGTAAYDLQVDDVLKIEAIGTAIKVYVNDVEKISVTDSAITTGKPGGIANGWTSYWIDFVGMGDIKGLSFSW